jgi:hypothetical protein
MRERRDMETSDDLGCGRTKLADVQHGKRNAIWMFVSRGFVATCGITATLRDFRHGGGSGRALERRSATVGPVASIPPDDGSP